MENIGSIIIENMSMPQKGKVRVLVLRDDGRCVDEFGNVYKVVPANRTDRQPMYGELISELRKESCGAKTTSWWRAADAIEKLVLELDKASNYDSKTSIPADPPRVGE